MAAVSGTAVGPTVATRNQPHRNRESPCCIRRFPITSGGRGIRTHDGCNPIAIFKPAAILGRPVLQGPKTLGYSVITRPRHLRRATYVPDQETGLLTARAAHRSGRANRRPATCGSSTTPSPPECVHGLCHGGSRDRCNAHTLPGPPSRSTKCRVASRRAAPSAREPAVRRRC